MPTPSNKVKFAVFGAGVGRSFAWTLVVHNRSLYLKEIGPIPVKFSFHFARNPAGICRYAFLHERPGRPRAMLEWTAPVVPLAAAGTSSALAVLHFPTLFLSPANHWPLDGGVVAIPPGPSEADATYLSVALTRVPEADVPRVARTGPRARPISRCSAPPGSSRTRRAGRDADGASSDHRPNRPWRPSPDAKRAAPRSPSAKTMGVPRTPSFLNAAASGRSHCS